LKFENSQNNAEGEGFTAVNSYHSKRY